MLSTTEKKVLTPNKVFTANGKAGYALRVKRRAEKAEQEKLNEEKSVTNEPTPSLPKKLEEASIGYGAEKQTGDVKDDMFKVDNSSISKKSRAKRAKDRARERAREKMTPEDFDAAYQARCARRALKAEHEEQAVDEGTSIRVLQAISKQEPTTSTQQIMPDTPLKTGGEKDEISSAVVTGYLKSMDTLRAPGGFKIHSANAEKAEPAMSTEDVEKMEETAPAGESDAEEIYVDSDNYTDSLGHDSDWDAVDDGLSDVEVTTISESQAAPNGEAPSNVDGKKRKGWFW